MTFFNAVAATVGFMAEIAGGSRARKSSIVRGRSSAEKKHIGSSRLYCICRVILPVHCRSGVSGGDASPVLSWYQK